MHISDFRLFLEVVEHGSFTRVAAQRSTVQSHISRQIGDLEKACGGALFRRTGRGVALTEFGADVERRVRVWLRDTDAMFADIRQNAGVPMGEVRLGILPSAAHPLMTRVFRRLRDEYPRIRLNIREGQGGELDAMLETGSVDMAILFRHDRPRGSEEVLLATAGTYLVSAPGQPLTAGDTVDFRRLAGLPLVLPRRPSHWRSLLDEAARSLGFTLQAEVEADSLRLQKELVADNPRLHALLGPFSIEEELRAFRLQAARVVHPDLKRFVTLALPRQGSLTPASRIVSRLIQDSADSFGGALVARGDPAAPAG
jgi:DNA-binding transcriptional LysR family regulator